MPTEACKLTHSELMFLGDILCYGIVKKGLDKVGSTPDTATPSDVAKALDAHIERALVSFVGPAEARQKVIKLKAMLMKLEGSGGGQA